MRSLERIPQESSIVQLLGDFPQIPVDCSARAFYAFIGFAINGLQSCICTVDYPFTINLPHEHLIVFRSHEITVYNLLEFPWSSHISSPKSKIGR